jgi:hypothetical protein
MFSRKTQRGRLGLFLNNQTQQGGDMEKVQAQPAKRTGLFGWVLRLKTLMVVFSLVGLLASNVLAVLHAGFHDLLYTGIRKALLAVNQGLADVATRKSKAVELDDRVRKETATLRKQTDEAHAKRAKAELDLDGERAKVKRAHLDLDDVKAKRFIDAKEAKLAAGRVRERMAKGVARNVSSVPAESVPYLGIGVTLGMTALDLYDACQTMKEFNELLLKLGQGVENDEAVCGMKLPTKEQVVANLGATWRKSYEDAGRAAAEAKAQIQIPQLQLPTWSEVRSVACPISTKLPGC